MADEATKKVRVAIDNILNGDSEAGVGLQALTGLSSPVRYEGSQRDVEAAKIHATYLLVDAPEGTKSGSETVGTQFTVWTHPSVGTDFLTKAEDARTRIKKRMRDFSLLQAEGLDAAPRSPRKRDIPPGEDGWMGLMLEMDFFNAS